MEALQKRSENPKRQLDQGKHIYIFIYFIIYLYSILTKDHELWRSDQTKEKGLWTPRDRKLCGRSDQEVYDPWGWTVQFVKCAPLSAISSKSSPFPGM